MCENTRELTNFDLCIGTIKTRYISSHPFFESNFRCSRCDFLNGVFIFFEHIDRNSLGVDSMAPCWIFKKIKGRCSRHVWRQFFHPAEACSERVYADLVHSYCLGWNRSIQAFAHSEIFCYSPITVAPFRVNLLQKCIFWMHKIEAFETTCNYVANPIF